MVPGTADGVADHLAVRQVGAEVPAVRRQHGRRAVLAAEADDAPVEDAGADDLARRDVGRPSDRVPALREASGAELGELAGLGRRGRGRGGGRHGSPRWCCGCVR